MNDTSLLNTCILLFNFMAQILQPAPLHCYLGDNLAGQQLGWTDFYFLPSQITRHAHDFAYRLNHIMY